MPSFSERSLKRLETCDNKLQFLFKEVVKHFDCTVLTGHRGKEEQDQKFEEGLSKVKFPNSRHNISPSMAVDVTPYPIDFYDRERITYFAGYVMGIATMMGIKLRWGGDWDRDTETKDNSFDDLIHFEVYPD